MKTELTSQTRGGPQQISELLNEKEDFDESIKGRNIVKTETITKTVHEEFSNYDTNPMETDTYSERLSTQTKKNVCKVRTNFKTFKWKFTEALKDHNYTSQKEILCQPNPDFIREILLNVIIPSTNIVKDIPTDIYNFIENTIKNLKLHKLQYAEKKENRVNIRETLLTNNDSQTRKTKKINQNYPEPLEIHHNDQYLNNIHLNLSNREVLTSLLENTMSFAKQLFFESKTFASKSERELRELIYEKIKKLKEILGRTDMNSKHLLNNRYEHNFKAKMNLILDTSESSQTEFELKSSCHEIKSESPNKSSTRFCSKQLICGSSQNKSHDQNFSDDIDLSKYIKLEITFKPSAGVFKELDTKIKPCKSDNDTDKEIERLINLRALSKSLRNRAHLLSEYKSRGKLMERSMTKSFPDQDEMDEYKSEQFYESEKNILTEDEFLSRYNEQIKHQLLNDSNSDSGLSNLSNYANSKESISEEDEASTCIVDKFLQVFKTDQIIGPSLQDVEESKLEYNSVSETRLNISSLEKQCLVNNSDLRRKKNEIVLSSESDSSDIEDSSAQKLRFIKPMLRIDQLAIETRAAQKNESERIRSLEKKNVLLSKVIKGNIKFLTNSDLILDYIDNTKTFIKVNKDLVKLLKPHQRDGVRFMYDSCYGGIDVGNKNIGSGCILAHCMGLGKTLQLIALLHTVISYKELNTSKILVLCPKSTVMNWADEFQQWLSGIKNNNHIKVFIFPDSSDISDKLRVLEEWSLSTQGSAGCLLVGYEAFRTLVFYHSYKYRGHVPSKLEVIRDKVNEYLLQPGADIVVCDEGHIIKNSRSAISLAVAKIKTPKRIILTGTPIQNNLKEYYSMVNFIKPLYLGTEREFANLYANPIKNGQHKDSSKKDITVMKQRSYVLHKKLSKFVQRKEAELLKSFLPEKFEYVLFIPMTSVQNTLYEYILEAISRRGDSRGKSLITDYTVLRKIWTHPKVLEDAWKNANKQKVKRDSKKICCPNSDEDQPDDIFDSQTGVMSVTNDWWRKYLTKKDLETVIPSNKLRVMFSIIRMCEEKGEKCLIFSAFVAVLNVVEYFFKKISESDSEILHLAHITANQRTSNKWINGQDYYRLDGKTPKNVRHEMIKRFNSESNGRARVFLISSRAGGQGINLIGANRVIILDTSWNPSNDQQNIFRIFRLGQNKNCYIYRLIAMGTMEEKVYSRSVTKQAMSFRVVDEQQIDRHYNMAELAELYTLTTPKNCERTMPVLPKDTILADLLRQTDLVYKYHEHDSLLENKVEQELSEQEKADAWDTYEKDLQINFAQNEELGSEKAQHNILVPRSTTNFGSTANLDMQSLLNYSFQSTSLIPHFNYGHNQNYFGGLNYFQKYSSNQLSEMDSYLKANVFAASNFGTNSIFTSALNVSNKGSPLTVPQLLHNQHVGPAAGISSDVISALEQYKHLLKTQLNSLNSNNNFGITNESTPERVETCLSGININSGDDYLFENPRAHHEPDFIQHSDSFGTARSTAHLKRSTTTLNKCAINNNNNMQLSSHNEINIIPNRAFRENDIMKMVTKNSVSMENIPTRNLPGTNHISKQLNEITPGIDSTSVSSIGNNDNNFMVHNQTSMVKLITPNNQNSKLLHNKSQCLSSVCSDVQKLNTTSKLIKSNQKKNRACPSDHNLEISLSGWMKRSRSKHNSGDKAKLCNENIGSAPVAVKMQNTERNIYNQDLKPQQKGCGNDCLFDDNSHSLRNNTMKRPTEYENDSLNLKRTKL